MITSTPEIDQLIRSGAIVAYGVSGGKDSSIAALATNDYLDQLGHTGPRVLIHADLGRVEWRQSMEICQRLAERLGLELIIVRRKAGGMMERWLTRWANNVERYIHLECVKLILPWSTPSMRFCTSELKTAVICAELGRRFKGRTIINVTGIRRAESSSRAKAPVWKSNSLLTKSNGTLGYDWHPIIDMSLDEVFTAHQHYGFPLHEAYTTFGSSRVSCAFCIMGNAADLQASAKCEDNQEIYREMCELEISSAFAFQSGGWLSDVAPHLLSAEQRERTIQAKAIQKEREIAESAIPDHLLYEKGWPKVMPTMEEAGLIAFVRRQVADLQGIEALYVTAGDVQDRYRELMAEKDRRAA